MPKIERKSRDFELVGTVQMVRTGTASNGDDWGLVSVSGFTFFLGAVWVPELHLFDEGQRVRVVGEYAGDSIRNGQRQPRFDVYEIVPVDDKGQPLPAPIPRVPVGGKS